MRFILHNNRIYIFFNNVKGGCFMKTKYKPPRISVELLEKTDILLASAPEPEKEKEVENRYGSFASFVWKELWE